MNRPKKRKLSHVVVRLTDPMHAVLEGRMKHQKARSIAPVVQQVLMQRMLQGERPTVCRRNPISSPKYDLFLRNDLVLLLKTWAKDDGATIGDMIFTLLSEELDLKGASRISAA